MTVGPAPAAPLAGVAVREADRPGDLGAVAALHGVVYHRELGTDHTREADIAAQLAAFARARGTGPAGSLWIADRRGRVEGSIGITPAGEDAGRLRWFLLHPRLRGAGLGRYMLTLALGEARRTGLRHVTLRTLEGLHASYHLYLEAGFRPLGPSRPARLWGIDVKEQHLALDLERIRRLRV